MKLRSFSDTTGASSVGQAAVKTYLLLAVLAFLTTLLVGIHVNWLWALTVLLLLAWVYVLSTLTLNPPKPTPLPRDLIPGDINNLDKLHDRALIYCNDIIAHYQAASYRTRRYYIVSQLLTVILSGLTPILVLIDRSDELMETLPALLQGALSWGMIVVPGIAAILATTSSVFNFQKQWIQAKQTAEFLEAVREEFMIGASPEYRLNAQEPPKKTQERKRALEHFIIKVNELHLKQVNRWAALQQMEDSQTSSPILVQQLEDNPQELKGKQPRGFLDSSLPGPKPDVVARENSPREIKNILSGNDAPSDTAALELEPPQPKTSDSTSPDDESEYLI